MTDTPAARPPAPSPPSAPPGGETDGEIVLGRASGRAGTLGNEHTGPLEETEV